MRSKYLTQHGSPKTERGVPLAQFAGDGVELLPTLSPAQPKVRVDLLQTNPVASLENQWTYPHGLNPTTLRWGKFLCAPRYLIVSTSGGSQTNSGFFGRCCSSRSYSRLPTARFAFFI